MPTRIALPNASLVKGKSLDRSYRIHFCVIVVEETTWAFFLWIFQLSIALLICNLEQHLSKIDLKGF
jgi:hypothetical protein